MNEESGLPAATDTTAVRRWDPFHTLSQLQADLDRFWEGKSPLTGLKRFRELPFEWTPKVDVFGRNGDIVVKAEVPGVSKDQLDVHVEHGDLVISGERSEEKEVKETDFYRMERSRGSFSRRISLPEGVKTDSIEAQYADGVLEVTIPKPTALETKTVQIAVK